MSDFVHLHVHSEYSLLDGLGKLDLLIDRVKTMGMNALAVTDHGAMYGSFRFYLRAIEAGIKPIIGVETYVAKRSRFDKEARIDTDPYHLVLLAHNETGYRNLLKLVTHAHLEGYYYRPRIDFELLAKHTEGLICLSACIQGELGQLILENKIKEAEETAARYAQLFGADHYYLELQKHPTIEQQEVVNKGILEISKKIGIPVVATNDVHYVNADDAEAQDILLCVQTQQTVKNPNRPMSMISSPDFYVKSPQEMKTMFLQYPDAIENTVKIADMCQLKLKVGQWILPQYPTLPDTSPSEHLTDLVSKRLKRRYLDVSQEIRDRISYELDIINKKGYATYFLIVSDFVNWAKDNGIAVGPGRGSAAGSVVSYILGITGIDPLYFKLPFERFLNPQRPSPPDIDLDFADDRRDEVIAYVTKKYGDDKVAQICTFGTMEARGSVRDAGRALGMPYAKPDRISKMIPPGFQGFPMTIEKAIQQSAELSLAYRTEQETKKLLDVAMKLEGVARHVSVHAAGVVIADKPLVEYTPLQKETKGEKIVTQYDMYTIGEDGVGLLKMDFLGLRNLTIMSKAIKFIKDGKHVTIDLDTLPLDDAKTYTMLSEGETTGVFQLESSGMRRYVKELRPSSIFDLMAMVALFRPGPMQVIPEFIKRKNSPREISYPDPRLAEVLSQSYGLICYQDDVLLTAITLAGYNWGDADKLRKAVGKKIPSEMKKQKEKFIAGCVKNGLSKIKAENIFHLIEPFAGYGFNKAHAACYAMIAYQTAFLKANYPIEYMTAVLSAESGANTGPARDEKISRVIAECRRMNIAILPPDINTSGVEFTIEPAGIRFGLSAIKNVGTAAIESILQARTKPFHSLREFLERVDMSKVNRKTVESLAKTGALDAFGKRSALLTALPTIVEHLHKHQQHRDSGQVGLFESDYGKSVHDEPLPDINEFPSREILMYEKELLGFYLTSHPLEPYLPKLQSLGITLISDIQIAHVGQRMAIGGVVTGVKKITTKAGNHEMAFVRLEDLTGTMEVVVFPKVFSISRNLLRTDAIIQVRGKIDAKDERVLVIADDIAAISDTV